MKASPQMIGVAQRRVDLANEQMQVGGMLAVNSQLKLFTIAFGVLEMGSLEMLLDAHNQLPPSAMREEFILLIEGMLALKEIKPIMEPAWLEKADNAGPSNCKEYGKVMVCRRCHHQNPENSFDCCNCGERIES